jgi:tRNA nucleotidyltransferase (CCA-adding enzyme)
MQFGYLNWHTGLLLRDKTVHNPIVSSHWTTTLLFSLLQELVPLYDAVNDEFNCTYKGSIRRYILVYISTAASAVKLIERYNAFVHRVEELKLPAAIDAKPILGVRSCFIYV